MFGLGLGLGIHRHSSANPYAFPFISRVESDGGAIRDKAALLNLTYYLQSMMPNTKLLYCPELGVKLRTSGVNNYVTTLYDISSNMLDGAQTTALNQPYLSGNVAPNEKYAIKNPNGGNAYLTHTPISFAATDKWSATFIYNNFNRHSGSYGIVLSDAGSSHIRFQSNSLYIFNNVSEYTFFSGINKVIGKYAVYTITAQGDGKVNLYLNGSLVATNTFNTGIVFARLFSGNVLSTSYGAFVYYSVRDISLSPTQVQEEYNYLRSLFPEIESVQIGTQTWATSNYEMTCTPQGNIIQEMQAATNVEKLSNGNFEGGIYGSAYASSGGTYIWKANTDNPITGTRSGNLKVSSATSSGREPWLNIFNAGFSSPVVGKFYKFSFNYRLNSGKCVLSAVYNGNTQIPLGLNLEGSGSASFYLKCEAVASFGLLYFNGLELFDIDIDDTSFQEVGWTDSTNLYNYIYANTSGTAEQKEYAAVKAAAMWCHYNNDPALGAIYGKMYNWYAVKLLQMDIDYYNAANPTTPWGWRVPNSSDFSTLISYLGGASVAGGKIKKEGLSYWASPNAGADNSSGFTGIGCGRRDIVGEFSNLNYRLYVRSLTNLMYSGSELLEVGTLIPDNSYGASLRLIKA